MNPLVKNVIFVLLFTLIGGLFSASEMALVSLRETQIDDMAKKYGSGRVIRKLTGDSNRFLSAVQVGVTISGFFSASFGASEIAPIISPVLHSWGMSASGAAATSFVAVTIVIAYLSIVFGELVPKRIALQSAVTIARMVAYPLNAITALLRPVIWLLGISTNAVLRLIGRNPSEQKETMGAGELRAFVASQDSISTDERDMLVGMLEAGDRTVEEIMTPRTEVEFVSADRTIDDVQQEVSRLEHSRYPVRQGSSDDDVIGFIHIRDLILPPLKARHVRDLVRDVMYFPTGKPVLDALTEMKARHAHLAVVVDEYGGTDGIMTIEDIVEEFVGEIRDEYDREQPIIIRRGNTENFDGLASRSDVFKALGRELPDGPFDTLAGFVVYQLGHMPAVGDTVTWEGLSFTVARMDARRIDRINVEAQPEDDTAA
ncbi:MAG: hemolysin family protein [Actinomycetaceae bacterium]|nr:hemolysin family protein [Actinomycetaceae bacterium]MDY6082908.1 hemolysin family protein [Actinomycetaceae bacterium]